MRARIYQPAKTAMQSGRANTRKWLLEYERDVPRRVDSLMGWSGSADTSRQVRLKFDRKEDAVAYAERHGIPYEVQQPHQRAVRPRAYADNFRYSRPGRA